MMGMINVNSAAASISYIDANGNMQIGNNRSGGNF